MDRECLIWLKNKSSLREADHQFGLWMRVATSNLAQRKMVKVARFEEDDSGYQGWGNTNDTKVRDIQGWRSGCHHLC